MSEHPIIERHIGITQAIADAKNRAWRPFKFWLQSKSAADLGKASPKDLADSYSPLEDWEIGDCIRMRMKTLEQCEKAGKAPPPLL